MSAETDKVSDTFADQLTSLDDRLDGTPGDVDMLADIQAGIGSLLSASGGNEATIRRVLQDRYEAGQLRKETFQLVKSMLDGYATEQATPPTSAPLRREPVIADPPRPQPREAAAVTADGEDVFTATAVIPDDAMPFKKNSTRVQPGSVLRDRYLLQDQIAGGSMGSVYKALDRRLAEAGSEQPCVAIKVLSPELAEDGFALRALQQEATKTRCLVHPHIVRFLDLDREDDLYFLILEWLEGRTLADILDSADARSIDGEAAFRIVRQIGEALDYAHRCGIIHADVKPGNIMMLPNGDAKLFDFGVARVLQQRGDQEFDPGVLGALTPAYSSMQVLGGEEPAATDDVFSLACLLYRLVAGYRVFGPRNAAEASQEGMKPQKPQGVNETQWKAMKKALSYSRVTRFASVKEFTDALGEFEEIPETPISIEAPERFPIEDEGGSPGKWIAIFVVVLGLAGIGAQQMGYLDPYLERWQSSDGIVDIAGPAETAPVIEDLAPEPELEIAPTEAEEAAADNPVADPVADPVDEPVEPTAAPPESTEPLVDFSKLPPPTAEVRFSLTGGASDPTRVVLQEDGAPVLLDFVREGDLSAPLALRLDEVGFSGNRSPWASGQYALSNGGRVEFPSGQERARVTLTTASDSRREADQQSTLRLRPADWAGSQLATVYVTLKDDDQSAFEGRLPDNTIAFTRNQISVSESDPAVQIDIIRFNPDDSSIVVNYTVEDISATEGEDYFAPGSYSISFGPGQRSARLLIPLVQDSLGEGDEAFVVKLDVDHDTRPPNVSPNIAVMIRDDEL